MKRISRFPASVRADPCGPYGRMDDLVGRNVDSCRLLDSRDFESFLS